MNSSSIVGWVWIGGWLISGLYVAYSTEDDDWFPGVALMMMWPLLIALAPIWFLLSGVNWLGRRRRRKALERSLG